MKTLDEFLKVRDKPAPRAGETRRTQQKQRKKLYGKELPEGWDVVNFGQIFDRVEKKSRKIKISEDKLYKLVTVKLYARGVVLREIKGGNEIKTKTMYRIKEGDFIISKIDARNGAYGFVPPELDGAVVSGDFPIWRLKERGNVDRDFVDFYLSQPEIWELIRNFVTGTTNRKRVSPDEFMYLIRIPLPPIEEQRKIVHVLKTVQKAIERQDQIIETTKELKKALMKRLFTKGLDPNQPTKMTEIGEIPEHWVVYKLERLFEVQQGKQLSKKQKSTSSAKLVPFLRTIHVRWGKVIIPNPKDLDVMLVSDEELSKFQVRQGDIFICEGGAKVGRTGIVTKSVDFELIYQNHLHRLRPLDDTILPRFFVYWMEHSILDRGLYLPRVNTTTIPNLSASRLKEFLIPVPPTLEEQQKIANILLTVDKKIELAQKKKNALEELFSTLRYKLMTGQIRVHKREIPGESDS